MRRTGPPEVLAVEQIAQAPLAAGEVRLRPLASAINHSDLEIRVGNWRIRRELPFPYVPGLEVVGELVEVARDVTDFAVGEPQVRASCLPIAINATRPCRCNLVVERRRDARPSRSQSFAR